MMAKIEKYTLKDLQQIQESHSKITQALLFVANELHEIYTVLADMKEKK